MTEELDLSRRLIYMCSLVTTKILSIQKALITRRTLMRSLGTIQMLSFMTATHSQHEVGKPWISAQCTLDHKLDQISHHNVQRYKESLLGGVFAACFEVLETQVVVSDGDRQGCRCPRHVLAP